MRQHFVTALTHANFNYRFPARVRVTSHVLSCLPLPRRGGGNFLGDPPVNDKAAKHIRKHVPRGKRKLAKLMYMALPWTKRAEFKASLVKADAHFRGGKNGQA